MSRFPALLTLFPMVGSTFDAPIPAVIEPTNPSTVPDHLGLFVLGRVLVCFANDRLLSNQFLQLLSHAAPEFLTQLPFTGRASLQATQYLAMAPVAATKVFTTCTKFSSSPTVVNPTRTSTSDMNPVALFRLILYLVHIEDISHLWLVKELCAGADVMSKRRTRKPPASAPFSAALINAAAGATAGTPPSSAYAPNGAAGNRRRVPDARLSAAGRHAPPTPPLLPLP